jgi:hypothetical protein
MLSAHQTVLEGWATFKSYPKLKELYLYNLLFVLMASLTQFAPDTPIAGSSGAIISFIASIASLLCAYLSYMAIAHYVMNDWVFKSVHDFIKPPSSLWRLFWKTLVIGLAAIIPMFGVGIIIELYFEGFFARFILGGFLALMALIWLIFVFVKLYLGIPHFSITDKAPLRSVFDISDGYFWYLGCILGWLLIYGIVLFVWSVYDHVWPDCLFNRDAWRYDYGFSCRLDTNYDFITL